MAAACLLVEAEAFDQFVNTAKFVWFARQSAGRASEMAAFALLRSPSTE